MPRRRKSGQSPARVPDRPPEGRRNIVATVGLSRAMENNFLPSGSLSSTAKEQIAESMHEMFSHLDPEVIYIVLSECDFKVEVAMDSLLQLSEAAANAAPHPPSISGFERTAADLLTPPDLPDPRPNQDLLESSNPFFCPSTASPLTEEAEVTTEPELEILEAKTDIKEKDHSGQYLSFSESISLLASTVLQQTQSPQSSLTSGPTGPLSQYSFAEGAVVESSLQAMQHTTAEKPKPPLDLAASGRPSAFQAYIKQDPLVSTPGRTEVGTSDVVVGGTRSKTNTNLDRVGNMSWNVEAPVFSPNNQEPTFITPVAQTSHNWPHYARQACPRQLQCHFSQAPLKPSATIPKSWALPPAPQLFTSNSHLRLEGNVLVLLRGASGSGKSTLARALLEQNPGGIILSTDNYFIHNGEYHFNPTMLAEAHEWNHKQAKEAFQRGDNPIIIDNTNMQGWEMKPYVALALKHGYKVLFKEPQTWWKNKPKELERRSTHRVHVETIRRMLNGYERAVTVQSIMGSSLPEHKRSHTLEDTSPQLMSTKESCPDLVGKPRLIERTNVSRSHLFSSLPDVSSISQSNELDDGSYRTTELTEHSDVSDIDDDLNLEHLDSELDARLQLQNLAGDQQIPDCIVESVMTEASPENDPPVAFSESIAQRVKRETRIKRLDPETTEAADLVKDTNQLESVGEETEETNKKDVVGREFAWVTEEPKVLEFVGDWPIEASLSQRQTRRERRKERNLTEDKIMSQKVNKTEPDVTERPEDLKLDQNNSSPIYSSSEENFPKEESGNYTVKLDPTYGHEEFREDIDLQDGMDVNSMGELPDCVLDWKTADYCRARKSKVKIEETTEAEGAVGKTINMSDGRETVSSECVPSVNATSLFVSSNAESDRCHDADNHNSDDGPADSFNPDCRESIAEADSFLLGEFCQSPLSEDSAEGQICSLSANSEEKKQRQGRRSGKQCKLALTFTQNYSDSLTNTSKSPRIPSDNTESHPEDSPKTEDQHIANTDSNLDPKPDPSTSESESEARVQSPSPQVDSGCFIQTEPQDFALLWRLNRQDLRTNNAAPSNTSSLTVLCGDSSRFVPALSSKLFAAVAVDPFANSNVLYRVVHEKGTQVEERDLGGTHDRLESLCILSRHFKLVCYDTLEDLYDKCHQDLEWTTNLLLDSGERFFKEEDITEVEKQELGSGGSQDKREQNSPSPCRAPEGEETSSHPHVSNDVSQSVQPSDATGVEDLGGVLKSENTTSSSLWPGDLQIGQPEGGDTELGEMTEPCSEAAASGGEVEDGVINEEVNIVTEDDAASLEEIHRLLQAELEELNEQEERRKRQRCGGRQVEEIRSRHLDIQSVELKLPTELAMQLIELFGPVGLDIGTCDTEDYKVNMDLHLAKLLHQKWKETVQETQRATALSFHREGDDGGPLPFMDHWNASHPHVSLRDVIKEELALQKNFEKSRQSRVDLQQRNGASLLKEDKLFSLFPNIDKHFLRDIFRDHNYSLTETELFLRSLLDEEPTKNVVAPEAPPSNHHRAASREREKKLPESTTQTFQDVEYPEYDDFRAEANLHRRRQLESFTKAAAASQQGRNQVASYYAQQGRLHGQHMREANRRAAVQIFERVNSSLLPRNILDLHGLHVDEALDHLSQVLEDKVSDCEKGLCRPELSVITGRGNHSQGGVARIRPAVITYLTQKQYRFTEEKGHVLVSLK